MIAVDTNILVYAHRRDCHWHGAALAAVRGLAEGAEPWAIAWPCVHEFLAIATHPRIWAPPSTVDQARAQVDAWLLAPTLQMLGESSEHWGVLSRMLVAGQVRGPQVHDARVAALCRQHGVRELWSADRDFGRFPELRVRNPLLA